MKARFIEFDEDGNATRKPILCGVYFASSADHPAICVSLPGDHRRGLHREIQISAKEVLSLIFSRFISKMW
jgi:hypothetical protein